ncbi:MAG: 20S proteasome subunit A/B [Haloplanus sp.]
MAYAGGVVLVGDRVVVSRGQVRSRSRRHVFDFGCVGAAVAGADVGGFADRLAGDVRTYRTERGDLGIDPFTRLASDLADESDASTVLAVTADGGVATDDVAAFGSGASVASGALEAGHDPDGILDKTTLARSTLSAAAERDAGTGTEFDVYRLPT